MYVAIMKTAENGRIQKYQPFEKQSDADEHVAKFVAKYPSAKVFQTDEEPSERSTVENGVLIHRPFTIPISGVKAEANRRILAVMPEYKQRNSLAKAVIAVVDILGDLADGKPARPKLNAKLAEMSETLSQWAEIERLRSKSNAIEAMDPIPLNFRDDDTWK